MLWCFANGYHVFGGWTLGKLIWLGVLTLLVPAIHEYSFASTD